MGEKINKDAMDFFSDYKPGEGDEKSAGVVEEEPEETPEETTKPEPEKEKVETPTEPVKPVEKEEPKEPEEPTPIEEEEIDYKAQNALLLKEINRLSVIQPAGEKATPAAPTPPTTPAEIKEKIVDFLKDRDLDEILDDKAKFNALLLEVYKTAKEEAAIEATQKAKEQIVQNIPGLIINYTQRHTAMIRMVENFYKDNPDLKDVSNTVARVANEVHAENPDKNIEWIFNEAASRTRKLLGLKGKTTPPVAPPSEGAKPALPTKVRGSRQSTPAQLEGLAKEINDLLS